MGKLQRLFLIALLSVLAIGAAAQVKQFQVLWLIKLANRLLVPMFW